MDQTLTLQPYVGTWPPDDPDAGFRWMEQKDEVEHVGAVVVVNAGSVLRHYVGSWLFEHLSDCGLHDAVAVFRAPVGQLPVGRPINCA